CHPADGAISTASPARYPVSTVHADFNWGTTPDEYTVDLTVDAPANGSYFVAGEKPLVTLKMTDTATGTLMDHTTITDANVNHTYLFVSGPRSKFNPVLTAAARAEVTSAKAEPWNLSKAANFNLKIDMGIDLVVMDTTGSMAGINRIVSGDLSIAVPAEPTDGSVDSFAADRAKVTASEIVAWLNGNATFKAVAIAEETESSEVTIRSRNLGNVYAVELLESDVTKALFGK
ncbi:MAG: hypothetical protein OEY59_13075, partial [Deltaproteobacteria bacterium]|nr:hypothetical protein [Deltaproteobacteria bacterium]